MTKKKSLTIGRLAKTANVNIETIRYYQRLELIIEPIKPTSGFRQYSVEIIERIIFIKRAQQLGFSLKEIKQLLDLGSSHCSDVEQLAIEKRQLIEQQITGLMTMKSALDDLINSCQSDDSPDHCGLISALSKKGFLNQ